jgi:protein ImuB
MQNLVHALIRDDVGARALRLNLYGVDGTVETIDIGLTAPTRSVPHVARLIDLKLEELAAMQEAGFGFEAIGLAVTRAEPMPGWQAELNVATDGSRSLQDDAERYAILIDTLRQRLGPDRVRRFEAVPRHIPEHAETLAAIDGESPQSWSIEEKIRPLLLLPQAEPTEVTALIPDGPPRRFRWRGVTYDITGAQGPERVGDEWWRAPYPSQGEACTRDYYLVEDGEGQRFWLYREGLYGRETATPRWFVHGLFA